MQEKEAIELFASAVTAIDAGDTESGMVSLVRLLHRRRTPLFDSYFAVCLAGEGKIEQAVKLCKGAREEEPGNPAHYLNLGRIYLLNDQKRHAIRAFRDGLLFDDDHRLRDQLNRLGWRNPPVLSMLPREHVLNRVMGKVRARLGFR